jgi:hypothetical protein
MAGMVRRTQALALYAVLAGCVSAPDTPQIISATRQPVQSSVGLEGVMGRNAAALTSRFGSPELDVREGNARKLQFANRVCVLDAYLYPRSGGEPVVTHIDARMPDGRDIDRASCVASLSLRD